MKRFQFLGLILIVFCRLSWAQVPVIKLTPAEVLQKNPQLVDISKVNPKIQVKMMYATPDNFMKQNAYGAFNKCLLVKDAAAKLNKAQKYLEQLHPSWRLIVYDCLRPRRVQLLMWNIVKGTAQQAYVANPHTGISSIHNWGCAVDLSIVDKTEKMIEMGTPFDFFGPAAEPKNEVPLLNKNQLTHTQVSNRLLLRYIMVKAGFYPDIEWWHFNCDIPLIIYKKYKLVE